MKRASFSDTTTPALPLLVLAAAFLFEFQAVLARCEGHFVYSLDDAYIHLALAERIASGHYGINWGEVSAPSSSIVWPVLLTLFAGMSFFEYVPLLVNGLCAAGTVHIYRLFFYRVFCGDPAQHLTEGEQPSRVRRQALVALFSIIMILASNLVGLAFTGMEHSLQVFLSVAAVYGLILLLEMGEAKPWFVAALVLAPLVRYECLALVVPILGILLWRKKWRAFGAATAGLLVGLGAFSLFLNSLGLGWLPTSVIAKSVYEAPGKESLGNPLYVFMLTVLAKVIQVQGVVLLAMVFLFIYRSFKTTHSPVYLLTLTGLFVTSAHFVVGRIGWWERYEVYVISAGILLMIYPSRRWLQTRMHWQEYLQPILLILLVSGAYIVNFIRTPIAAANIYEQQYQMHRFVVDVYRAPVAVNDLGWVAFRNPNYVLDLWGLASTEALTHRINGDGLEWMDEMAQNYDVRLAMIYASAKWFPKQPDSWKPVARLYLGQPQASVGGNIVTFFVLDEEIEVEVREKLEAFSRTLPVGVRLEFEPSY